MFESPWGRAINQELFQQGLALHQAGRLPDAEACYRAVLAADPAHYGPLFALGLICLAQRRFADAVELFDRAAHEKPEAPEPHACLGDAHFGLARLDRAIEAYETAVRLRPEYPEAHNNLGNALERAGRAEQAVTHFEEALRLEPDFALAHNNLAISLQSLDRWDEAIGHLQTALRLDPSYAEAHSNLGNALRAAGNDMAAAAHYEAALALDPSSADAENGLATALHALGRPGDAIAHFERALTRRPGFPEAHCNMGNALHTLARFDEAIAQYKATLALQPANLGANVGLGASLEALDLFDEASTHFQAALQLDPQNARAHQGMAVILLRAGAVDAAQRHGEIGFSEAVRERPYRGELPPVPALILSSALGRNILAERWVDDQTFLAYDVVLDFAKGPIELPAHRLVVNTICEADLCRRALTAAVVLLAGTQAPVINHPERVLATGRVDNARRLGQLPGVVAPRTALFSREFVCRPGGAGLLEQAGFMFPLLLRSPGFHTGQNFVKVDRPAGLANAVGQLPGKELLAIEFIDTRGADGNFRKYRVLLVDGSLYPLHLAISAGWLVHFFSAGMGDHPEHRAEDARFLTDMAAVLGADVVGALERISSVVGLDYGAIDFGLDPAGHVVLFEANAAVNIPPLPADDRWAYRRRPVGRAEQAVRTMLLDRAG